MDQAHLLVAARYVELDPLRAGLIEVPEAYKWSRAATHLSGRDDGLVKVSPPAALIWINDMRNSRLQTLN